MGLMKTKAISSIFVLFAIAAGMASMAPAAYADHAEVAIGAVEESGFSQSCELKQVVTHQLLQQLTSVVL